MKLKRLPFKEFMRIYHKVPRAAVDVIVVSKKGFLLTKRAIPPFKGMWHIPGGTILFKESINHAVDRIAKEELGIQIRILKHLGVIEYFDDEGRHTISNGYLVKKRSGKLKGSEQGEEIRFFNKIPRNFIPEQKRFVSKHLELIKHCLL